MKKDIEHLNLLGIFHYVMAGLTALMAFIPLIYVALGVVIITSAPAPPAARPGGPPPGPPPAVIGWVMAGFGGLGSVMMFAAAILVGMAGYGLQRKKWRIFCFVVAGLLCTQAPIGTILGVFTILVLCRPGMPELFSGKVLADPEDDDVHDPLPLDRRDWDRPAPRLGDEGYYAPRGDAP